MTSRRDLELDVVIAACASIHAALAPARFAEGYDRVHRHALQMAAPSRRGSCGSSRSGSTGGKNGGARDTN